MEKHLNDAISEYIVEFKNNIRDKIIELGLEEGQSMHKLMEYIYEYPKMEFKKGDVAKRKRNKNAVPDNNRCNARLANNEQCTRRRKDGSEYCGTHVKGTPNGQVSQCGECKLLRTEVTAKEIDGIVYYIDEQNRIYNTEQVMSNKQNPDIIGYLKDGRMINI